MAHVGDTKHYGLKQYATGIVARDSKIGDKGEIEIYIMEPMAEYTGDIDDEEILFTTSDSIVGFIPKTVKKRVTVKANWLNTQGDERITPPLVKKGETVIVYRVPGVDQFFWSGHRNEPKLRRKDAVVKVYGNTDKHGEIHTKKNTWYTIMDTINKIARFKTNKNDKEATWYDFLLDAKKGIGSIIDGMKNKIILYSKKKKIYIETDHVVIIARKSVYFKTEDFKIDTKTFTLNTNTLTTNAKTITEKSNTKNQKVNNYNRQSSSHVYNAASLGVNAPTSFGSPTDFGAPASFTDGTTH